MTTSTIGRPAGGEGAPAAGGQLITVQVKGQRFALNVMAVREIRGVTPPTPDWGQMLNDLRQSIYDRPVLSLVPAIAIFIASVGFNLLGDGLRRMLDVKEEVGL